MAIRTTSFIALQLAGFVLLAWMLAAGQAKPDGQNKATEPATPGADYSGMYSFLTEGEFVQITVEGQGHVIGFVSRYANKEGEGGFFFFQAEDGIRDGNRLAFTTKTVHGVSFE